MKERIIRTRNRSRKRNVREGVVIVEDKAVMIIIMTSPSTKREAKFTEQWRTFQMILVEDVTAVVTGMRFTISFECQLTLEAR